MRKLKKSELTLSCAKQKTKQKPPKQKNHHANLEQPTFYVNTLTKMLVVLRNSTSVQK